MKNFKKIMALILVAVMSLSLLSGCQKESKKPATIVETMQEATSFEKYSYKIDADVKFDLEDNYSGIDSATISIFGDVDGNDMTMGVKIKTSLFSFETKDLLILKDNQLYIKLEDALETVLALSGDYLTIEDIEEMAGFEVKCIQIPVNKDMLKLCKDMMNNNEVSFKIIEKGLKNVDIKENKGEFSFTIDDPKALIELVNDLAKAVVDSKDELEKLTKDNLEGAVEAFAKAVTFYCDEVFNILADHADELDLGVDKDEILAAKQMLLVEINKTFEDGLYLDDILDDFDFGSFKEFEDINYDDVKDDFDTIKFLVDVTSGITGKTDAREYNSTISITAEESTLEESFDVKLSINMVENKKIEIKAPSKFTSFEDIIVGVFKLYGAELLDM